MSQPINISIIDFFKYLDEIPEEEIYKIEEENYNNKLQEIHAESHRLDALFEQYKNQNILYTKILERLIVVKDVHEGELPEKYNPEFIDKLYRETEIVKEDLRVINECIEMFYSMN